LIVDTSALIAILRDEPEAEAFAVTLAAAPAPEPGPALPEQASAPD
jgi:uncharacterized protein with PIN domain